MEIIEAVFYFSVFFNAMIFLFVIFSNIEEFDFIRKRVENEHGNIVIYKLNILRIIEILVIMSPLIFLKDVFYIRIFTGLSMAIVIGFLMPVR